MRILLALSLLLLCTTTYSQSLPDSIFNAIDNKGVEIGIILPRGVCLTCGNRIKKINQDSIRQNRRYAIVTSFAPYDIFELAKKYSKEIIARRLYLLLADTSKDLYANVLLYDLLNNKKLLHFFFNPDKETWISSGRRKEDVALWDSTIKAIAVYK